MDTSNKEVWEWQNPPQVIDGFRFSRRVSGQVDPDAFSFKTIEEWVNPATGEAVYIGSTFADMQQLVTNFPPERVRQAIRDRAKQSFEQGILANQLENIDQFHEQAKRNAYLKEMLGDSQED